MIFGAQAHVIWKTAQFNLREVFHPSVHQTRPSITILARVAILILSIMVLFSGIRSECSGLEVASQKIELNKVGNPNQVGLQLMKVYLGPKILFPAPSLSLKWLIC